LERQPIGTPAKMTSFFSQNEAVPIIFSEIIFAYPFILKQLRRIYLLGKMFSKMIWHKTCVKRK